MTGCASPTCVKCARQMPAFDFAHGYYNGVVCACGWVLLRDDWLEYLASQARSTR